jgi:preprotein translocase subunit YajC
MSRVFMLIMLLATISVVGVATLSAPLQAQQPEVKEGAAAANADEQPQSSFWQNPMFMIMIIFGLFYFIMMRPGQKKEKNRGARVATIEKNTQVITRGGIIGKVISVHEDRQELTIITDEKTDTRLKMSRSGIWDIYEPPEADQ